MTNVIVIYLEPIYDSFQKTYTKILTVGQMPSMPLAQYVRKIYTPSLSGLTSTSSRCVYALLKSLDDDAGTYGSGTGSYLEAEDIPRLLGYLVTNGYTLESGWTNVLQKSKIEMSNNNGTGGRRTLVFICREP